MGWFMLGMKLFFSFCAIIWNALMGIINYFISIYNKSVREKNDKIKRGVTDIKQASPDLLFPDGRLLENVLISGGDAQIRGQLISQIVRNANSQQYPVVVLHEGNRNLTSLISRAINSSELINVDSSNPVFEPFYSLQTRDISKLLMETATPDYDIKKNAMYYIEGMCEFLNYKKIRPTLKSFCNCPHHQLFDSVDNLIIKGTISDTQGQALKSKLMMGQSEQVKLESLLNDLYDQGEQIVSKSKGSAQHNIAQAIQNNKVIMIDISSNLNVLLLNILLIQLRHTIIKGRNVVFVADEISTAGNEIFKKVICERTDKCKIISSNSDIFAMCAGDDKVFNTIVGNSEQIVILGHSSGASCSKWAETIGYYDKEEESSSYAKGTTRNSPFTLFPGSNNTATKIYNIKREYIVKPEQINRMSYNEVYSYSHSENRLIHTYLQ